MIRLQITSDRNNIIPLIQDAITARMKRTEIGLHRTEHEIRKFETKYDVLSDKFLTAYTAEDLAGGDEDYISWFGELKLREALLEELQVFRKMVFKGGNIEDSKVVSGNSN